MKPAFCIRGLIIWQGFIESRKPSNSSAIIAVADFVRCAPRRADEGRQRLRSPNWRFAL
jgi:hypothetical protein